MHLLHFTNFKITAMYNGILHAHSGLRWIALLLLVLTVVISLLNWMSKKQDMSKTVKGIFRANTMFIHIQLLLGLVLLFISPKVNFSLDSWSNAAVRFYTMEHSLMMIIAVVLVTIGGAKMKRVENYTGKYKTMLIYNAIALLIIFAMIPWPFRGLGAGWF